MPAAGAPDLTAELLSGNRRALARLLTLAENHADRAAGALTALYPHTGRAYLVGITGAPGTGKSTLVNQIALALRRREQTVGIVAVDPTSPFSGGAIMGDRIRMRDLSGDPGVFIRSMATRGSLGGLARATTSAVTLLDAAGFDVILIETVGAGQAEVDIARLAHSVVVVEAPGLGDDVQAIKAGILEIADVLVVNKADDPRADQTARALQSMLSLAGGRTLSDPLDRLHHGRLAEASTPQPPPPPGWAVPIPLTNALTGDGVPDLLAALDAHRQHLLNSGEWQRRERARALAELDALLREALLDRLLTRIDNGHLAHLVDRIVAREIAPLAAVTDLLEGAFPPR